MLLTEHQVEQLWAQTEAHDAPEIRVDEIEGRLVVVVLDCDYDVAARFHLEANGSVNHIGEEA